MRSLTETSRLSLLILLVLFMFIVSGSQAASSTDHSTNLQSISLQTAGQEQTGEILFQDDFTRSDSPSLGMPWTERNEITTEFIPTGGAPVGPGFIELNSGSLTFHYINHSLRPQFFLNSVNARPLVFAPLTRAVSSFPVELSFTFSPHQDGRIHHEVGLMAVQDGFWDVVDQPGIIHSTPKSGLGISLTRTASGFNNSTVQIIKYEGGVRTILAEKSVAFQFEFGVMYSIKFTVAQDFSTTVQVSNGAAMDQVSSTATPIGFSLNQFFITDTQGGISSNTLGAGDFLLRFDNVLVTQANTFDCCLLADRAAEIATTVIGSEYLFGGKGWDWNVREFVDANQIRLGYNYCHRFDKCGTHLITGSCEILQDKGLDCSGLIFWSYNKANRSTAYQVSENPIYWESADSQYRWNSLPVSEGELKPGDLMFFNFGREPGLVADHVAMYIGGDERSNMVEALNCNAGIKFSSKDELKRRMSFLGSQGGFRRIRPPQIALQVITHSPINLAVTDPDGFTITADQFIVTDHEILREIPGVLYYSERDMDGGGRLDDLVSAPILKAGAYLIKVMPKPGTLASDTYSLEAVMANRTIPLAENVPIRDIPSQGYVILSTGGSATSLDTILQDESSSSIFRFNSTNGIYQFSKCGPNGFTLVGTGQVIKHGCTIVLQDFISNRRVLAQSDTCLHKGIASVQVFSRGATFTISDRNTTNDTGTCR